MALYVKQDQQRSELRERIAAEMRAKAAAAQQDEPASGGMDYRSYCCYCGYRVADHQFPGATRYIGKLWMS